MPDYPDASARAHLEAIHQACQLVDVLQAVLPADGLVGNVTDNLRQTLIAAAELAATAYQLRQPSTLEPGELIKQALHAELTLCLRMTLREPFDDRAAAVELHRLVATVKQLCKCAAEAITARQCAAGTISELRNALDAIEEIAGDRGADLKSLQVIAASVSDALAAGCESIVRDFGAWRQAQRTLHSPLN